MSRFFKNFKIGKMKINIQSLRKYIKMVRRKEPRKSLDKDFRIGRNRIETNLNIRLISGFLGTLFFVMFLLTFFAKRSMEGTISNQLDKELNRTRRTSIFRIEEFYREIELEMSRVAKNYKEERYPNVEEIVYKNLGVQAIYILDEELEDIYFVGRDEAKNQMKKRIEELSFQESFHPEGFRIDDGIPNQYIFYKTYDRYKKEAYVIFKIDSSRLDKVIENRDFNIDIVNDEYYVIVSTVDEKVNDIQLDEITKNVLGGETGIASKDGVRYSYGFIDLKETALFIMSYRSEKEYYKPLAQFKRRIVMIWLFSLFCGIAALILIKLSIASYSSKLLRISLERASDLRYPFLKKEYLDVFEETDNIKREVEEVLEFILKLELLKIRIENQNKNFIKDIKHEKNFIKKLKTNKEIRDLFKNELDEYD